MDQQVVAGIGNVYRAELLYRHRIDPFRPGRALPGEVWTQMWADLVVLMRAGVRTGRIVTVRDEDRARRGRLTPAEAGLRVPPHRIAVPGVRHRDPHAGAGRPESVLVPEVPKRLRRWFPVDREPPPRSQARCVTS